MRRDETGRSIYSEMAARRSRCERLQTLAREQGLAVSEEQESAVPLDAPADASALGDWRNPADGFAAATPEPPAQEETAEADWVAPASDDPLISYGKFEVEDLPDLAASVPEPEDAPELGAASRAEEISPAASQSSDKAPEEPPSPEETIAASEPLLEEDPQSALEEARAEAESLVDQIGPILDIQRLPKTQPTRVLSKTAAKPQELKREGPTEPAKASLEREEANSAQPTSVEKPKRKRVSLLDSYFKGL